MLRMTGLMVLGMAVAGCGEATGPREPTPGPLTVSLGAPEGVSTGAVVVVLSGPEPAADVRAVEAAHRVYSRNGTGVVKTVVFGTIVPGPLLRFDVPDTGDAEAWSVTIVEAAGIDNAVKPLTGYTVTVSD